MTNCRDDEGWYLEGDKTRVVDTREVDTREVDVFLPASEIIMMNRSTHLAPSAWHGVEPRRTQRAGETRNRASCTISHSADHPAAVTTALGTEETPRTVVKIPPLL